MYDRRETFHRTAPRVLRSLPNSRALRASFEAKMICSLPSGNGAQFAPMSNVVLVRWPLTAMTSPPRTTWSVRTGSTTTAP